MCLFSSYLYSQCLEYLELQFTPLLCIQGAEQLPSLSMEHGQYTLFMLDLAHLIPHMDITALSYLTSIFIALMQFRMDLQLRKMEPTPMLKYNLDYLPLITCSRPF